MNGRKRGRRVPATVAPMSCDVPDLTTFHQQLSAPTLNVTLLSTAVNYYFFNFFFSSIFIFLPPLSTHLQHTLNPVNYFTD